MVVETMLNFSLRNWLNKMWLQRGTTGLLGVDIGSATVKVIELSYSNGSYKVEHFAVEPLPKDAMVEKTIKDRGAVIDATIKAIQKANSQIKDVAIALPDANVITKVVAMDADVSEIEMGELVLYEADKFVPYSLKEVYLDYDVLGATDKNSKMINVLIVASRAENVNNRVAVMESAGLNTKIVDIESYAVEQACQLLYSGLPEEGRGKTIAIVDIGAKMTNVFIMRNMQIVFSREEVFGGTQLTQQIQQRYDLSYEEAEKAKKTRALPEGYLVEVLIPFLDTAVLEVRRALQFYFSASQTSSIDHILLAGGGAKIAELPEIIQRQLNIKTTVANPFVNMTLANHIDGEALKDEAPGFVIGCGLAMRGIAPRLTRLRK